MAATMLAVTKIFILRCQKRLLQILGSQYSHDFPPPPALAIAGIDSGPLSRKSSGLQDAKSLIDSIFDGLLYAAVPKRRRSLQVRLNRKSGWTRMAKWATPKKNIVSCLECGHWHEAHTICGNCYEKVREETRIMRDAMDQDDQLYNAPKTEVVYLYEGEKDERPMHDGKYIVEMEKKRPNWWPANLLTKGYGEGR